MPENEHSLFLCVRARARLSVRVPVTVCKKQKSCMREKPPTLSTRKLYSVFNERQFFRRNVVTAIEYKTESENIVYQKLSSI